MVGNDKLRIDFDKVGAIQKWPTPWSATEVKSFVGACKYLLKFMWNFLILASPLHILSKTRMKKYDAFQILKMKISKVPVLALPKSAAAIWARSRYIGLCHGGCLASGWSVHGISLWDVPGCTTQLPNKRRRASSFTLGSEVLVMLPSRERGNGAH